MINFGSRHPSGEVVHRVPGTPRPVLVGEYPERKNGSTRLGQALHQHTAAGDMTQGQKNLTVRTSVAPPQSYVPRRIATERRAGHLK
jgi:hypothetical protein